MADERKDVDEIIEPPSASGGTARRSISTSSLSDTRGFHARNRNMESDDLRMHQKICAIFRKIAILRPVWGSPIVAHARDARRSPLRRAIALAMRLGYLMQLRHPLFDLPEHPDESRT
jgi:hypothetical protein